MPAPVQEDGFYWVRICGQNEWIVAEWKSYKGYAARWLFTSGAWFTDDVKEVDERRLTWDGKKINVKIIV